MDESERTQVLFAVAGLLAAARDRDGILEGLPRVLVANVAGLEAAATFLWDRSRGALTSEWASGREDGWRKIRQAALAGGLDPDAFGWGLSLVRNAEGGPDVLLVPLAGPQGLMAVVCLVPAAPRGVWPDADRRFFERVGPLVGTGLEARLASGARGADIISTLAHDLRTPLTAIKGYTTALLLDDATRDESRRLQYLRLIDEETDTLQQLITQLLESTLVEAERVPLEMEPVLLRRLVEQVIEEVARRSPTHRLSVQAPEAIPVLRLDPQRVAQVLRNLLDNAVKYSPEGGNVTVHLELRPGEVVVAVADEGPGIAPGDLKRLFEKFFRAKVPGRRPVVGTGLGLPIARAIVESHGGKIWAESHLDRGTTVSFTLPRHDVSLAAEPEP